MTRLLTRDDVGAVDAAAGVIRRFEIAAAHSCGRSLTRAQKPISPFTVPLRSRGTVNAGVFAPPVKMSILDPLISILTGVHFSRGHSATTANSGYSCHVELPLTRGAYCSAMKSPERWKRT